jgi:ferritin-like metal-binding protein YciE
VQRLQQIVDDLGESAKGKKCHGMEGIIAEGAELIEQGDKSAVLDAGLISAAQHVEHYEMAGYGSVRTWAQQLGHDAHVMLLQETLNEEKETDRLLTQLATQSINLDAESEIDVSEESPSSHRSKPSRRPASAERPQSSD